MIVGPGGYHTIALTTQDQVYSWGHNRVGQLGYSINQHMSKNQEGAYFLPTPQLVPLPILSEHFNLIGRQDIVESMNDTTGNISGMQTSQSLQSSIQIKQVVAGWGHSCLVTTDGVGYVCGRNQHGQLGLGEPSKFPINERNHHYQPYFIPVKSLLHRHISFVSSGGEHTVFCTTKNEIYSTGRGHKGQLGHNNKLDYFLPTKIEFFTKLQRDILQITCGNSSTLFLIGQYSQPLSLVERCIEEINFYYFDYAKANEQESDDIKKLMINEMLHHNMSILRNILPPHQSQLLLHDCTSTSATRSFDEEMN